MGVDWDVKSQKIKSEVLRAFLNFVFWLFGGFKGIEKLPATPIQI